MQRRPLGLVLALAVSLIGGTASIATAAPLAPTNAHHVHLGAAAAKTTKKTIANLNLRKSASTKSASWLVIPKNTTLAILKTSGTWSQVTYKAKTGWVSSDYLSVSIAKPAAGKTYNYTKSFVSLKAAALTSSQSVLDLHRQSKVEVLGKSGSWVKVAVSGKTGFVPASSLQASNPAAVYRWTNGNQKVYKSAATSSQAFTTLKHNTKITWLRTTGAWQQVRTSAGIGWVPSKGLATSEIKPAPKVYNFVKSYVEVNATAAASSKTVVALHRQSKVEVLGKSGSWVKITSSGKTGFVPASSLQASNPATVYRWVKGSQRVFAGASTSSKTVATLPQNSKIEWLRTSGSWQQVKTGAGIGWIQGTNLSNAAAKPPMPPTPKYETERWTTDYVNLRTAGSPTATPLGVVPIAEKVMMATTVNGWSQVKTSRGTGWMSAAYLSATPAPAKDPVADYKPAGTQYRWTTANLNLRTGNATFWPAVAVVPKGEKLSVLESSNGWARVKTSVGEGWVSASYLSTAPVGQSAIGTMQPDTLAVIEAVKARYGVHVSSFGGIRAGSTGHSSGKATDIMIKDYKNPSSIRKGDEIVDFLIRNQKELGISYVIWQDKIWLGNYLGWQEYSASGKYGNQFTGNWNDTTKHLDHIHAETYGNQATGGPLK